MNVRTINAPAVEPIPLAEAKLHLRVDHADEDGLIRTKITGAREHLEDIYGRALITRTLAATLDEFPSASGGLILLPFPPATELVSITYYDADGVQQTLDPADYEFDPYSAPARLRPSVGSSWPATEIRFSAVEIQWKAGFGDDPTDVPEKFREAVKLALGDLYENRETIVLGLNVNTTKAIENILWTEKIHDGNLDP
jgi:uncharacterized phiE125 gp8 family phage protein